MFKSLKKVILGSLLSILFLSIYSMYFIKSSYASEGIIELRSTTQASTRCFVVSLLLGSGHYRVVVSCVDLIYPPIPPNVYTYILWANPSDGGSPIKLGELGYGKQEFSTREPFTSLFVTTEPNAGVWRVSGTVVMQGGVQPIEFLNAPTTPTPIPEGQEGVQEEVVQQQSTRDKLLLAFRRAGIAALLALVAVVGLVFVLTRSRG